MKKTLNIIFFLISVVSFIIMIHLIQRPSNFQVATATDRIKERMHFYSNECKQDYWFSWIIFDERIFRRYYYNDVIGCSPLVKYGKCSFSVKEKKLNSFYNQDYHKIDKITYNFLTSFETGEVGYYYDFEDLKNYPTIMENIKATNLDIKEMGITVVKNKLNSLIYVFTITKTNKKNLTCNKDKITHILQDLAIFAHEQYN